MVATNAPRPGNVTPGQAEPDVSEFGFDDPATLTPKELLAVRRRHSREPGGRRHRDPSPAEIREACLAIQEEWSPAERRARAGAFPASDAHRKHVTRQLNRHGYVRGWTPPVCRDFSGGKGVR